MPVVESSWHSPLPAGLNATFTTAADGTPVYTGTGMGNYYSLEALVKAFIAANPGSGKAPSNLYRVQLLGVNEAIPADVPLDVVLLRRRTS